MSEMINLNKARKAKAREDAKTRADANARKFGLTKAERLLNATREKQAADRLSQLKFDDD